ncbi:acetyltransferase [Antribacter sp. KLBMP9083]|uniref:Lysine N-acyltransferase MbtK n=1 Tax=Antribacter soli TaxID=2910976 RepID=A0AA41QCE7_9MICO|nr:GNAT family N-acetyltransferase [Antribacter soli]MCF4120859.1 acetyltransferase [Antribacter soli]
MSGREGRLLKGDRGEEVWRGDFGAAGTVTAHLLDPDGDLDVLHDWVTKPRAVFWGLGDLTREELRETYEFVESLPTHDAYLVRWDGEPVVLLQAYHPEDDPVASAYDVQPGDLGFHFFLGAHGPGAHGPGAHGPGRPATWSVLGPSIIEFLLAGPGTDRLVAEPDARNEKAVARVAELGFELGERVTFESAHGPKDAQLVFLGRARGEAVSAALRGEAARQISAYAK